MGFIICPVACAAATASGAYLCKSPISPLTLSCVAVTPFSISVVVSPMMLRMSARRAVAAFVPDSCVVAVIVPIAAIVWSTDMPAIAATLATIGKPSEIFCIEAE